MNRRLFLAFIVFLVGANLFVWSLVTYDRAYAEKIYPGVRYNNLSLTNLTLAEAEAVLVTATQGIVDQSVNLTFENKVYTPTLTQLGYTIDTETMAEEAYDFGRSSPFQRAVTLMLGSRKTKALSLHHITDETKLADYLSTLNNDTLRPPKDMSLVYKNGGIQIVPGEAGVTLNQSSISDVILAQIIPGQTTELVLTPQITTPTIAHPNQVAVAKATAEKWVTQALELKVEDTTLTIAPETLFSFITFDIEDNQLVASLDEGKIQNHVEALAKKADITPVAKRIWAPDNSIRDEGRDGRKIKRSETAKLILAQLQKSDFTSITVPFDRVERKVVTEYPDYQLGRTDGRYLEISLKAQKLYMIEGSNLVNEFRVSTGKWSTPTPKGEFSIQNHITRAWSARYRLYMPNWMAIVPSGEYGIHALPEWPSGAKEGENHIGTPVSHGCIRLASADSIHVYDWAVNGTKVFIHD